MTISVIIPVKNGGLTLRRCLQSIRKQSVQDIEIIIADSMSTDDSREIAAAFEAKNLDVPLDTFDHGWTRNMAANYARGDLIYFTVQDAWIPDEDMLERMAKHFEDRKVMAVTGHQATPHERDKNPVKWYRRYSEYRAETRQIDNVDDFKSLHQSEQQQLVAWDNVVAMYRKSALKELPFVKTEMAEDWIWSYHALLKGWKLVRDSSLVVYHYHHATMRYILNSTYSVNYHFYKHFGYKPSLPPVVTPALRAIYHLMRNKQLSFREKIYWISHNFKAIAVYWYSTFNFLRRLKLSGKNGISGGYRKYCREIPLGRQKA